MGARAGRSSASRTTEIDHEALAAFERAGMPDAPPEITLPPRARRGRGATENPAVRFDAASASPFDDGWGSLIDGLTIDGQTIDGQGGLPALETTLTRDSSRTAISYNDSPDIGFDRAINPYRGCEHGCVYCYARPTHAYLGLSPGLDFETRLIFKPEIADLLERELRKPGYVPRTIALGSNTDPYQPVERTLKLTRSVLEVLERFGHPVSIVTKSAGVLRDADILGRMAERGLARVYLSVTTLDASLARRMEPRAATPARRLAAIEALSRASIPACVLAAPMIPGLNDAELERIIEAAARAGARHAGYVLLRLPHELRAIFSSWLDLHFPERAKHVLSLIRETRAGNLNDARFGHRFAGTGVYADLLARRFARAAKQWGADDTRPPLDVTQFRAPETTRAGGFAEKQMALF